MLRKTIIAMVLALIGLFAATGPASAATDPYQPPPAATLSGTSNFVAFGSRMSFRGSGFQAGEEVLLTFSDGRTQEVAADASGNFAVDLTFTVPGLNTVTAFGESSHKTASFTVTVSAGGTTTALGTTTVEVTTGTGATGTGGSEGTGSETSTGVVGAGSGSGSGAGLASTGANIAGPLTLGMSALLAGLALLFFGTRLAIRRKQGPSAH